MAKFIKLTKRTFNQDSKTYEYLPVLVNVDRIETVSAEIDTLACVNLTGKRGTWFLVLESVEIVEELIKDAQ